MGSPAGRAAHPDPDPAEIGGPERLHQRIQSVVPGGAATQFDGSHPKHIDYVLSPFSKRQREEVEVLIEDGADAVMSLVTDGLARTQDRFNRAGTQPSPGPRA
jgi:hypothetical protein